MIHPFCEKIVLRPGLASGCAMPQSSSFPLLTMTTQEAGSGVTWEALSHEIHPKASQNGGNGTDFAVANAGAKRWCLGRGGEGGRLTERLVQLQVERLTATT
jgi:hypothetical protein